MEFLEQLLCPVCRHAGLRLSTTLQTANGNGTNDALPAHGYAVCDRCGSLHPIAGHILDLLAHEKRLALTPAGWSNHMPPTARAYEDLWRVRSLGILTGEKFPLAREFALLNEWLGVQAGQTVVDLGASTGLYARGLAGAAQRVTPTARLIAVDAAWEMLAEARRRARAEDRRGIVFVRVTAETLPFPDGSIDGIACGGSLNEMQTFDAPLREAARVVKPGGRMFVMSLARAATARGRFVQGLASAAGIRFPARETFNRLVEKSGWQLARQQEHGIVLFSLLVRE
jgi:SAM-dependent methyltransferase